MSGDFYGYKDALTNCFYKNYYRYRADQPLRNIIDKSLGYVPGSQVTDTHI